MQPFQSCYLLPVELQNYDLPTPAAVPSITSLVQFASAIIDESCGRLDDDGNGSLAYTTYTSRILMQSRNRNLLQLPMRPVVGLTSTVINTLIAAASVSGDNTPNYYYTGVIANTINQYNGTLSGIISASGRYGYPRQDMSVSGPDFFAQLNPINLLSTFGGPAPFVSIDITNTDYDPKTGECWIPVGIQMQRYTEVVFSYNSGFNPLGMPMPIRLATAALTKNLLSKGGGVTGLNSVNLGKSGTNISMQQAIIDPTVQQFLTPFRSVRAY
jgi:hypothetical protein